MTALPTCERVRDAAEPVWRALHAHPFVRELASGTLAADRFRFYVEQNLMYLPEYARAVAIGATKADDLETMTIFASELVNIIDNEIPENRALLQRAVALGAKDRGGNCAMAPACVAYTGFLVSTALQGGPPEIMAAILPCTWSYGDIGASLLAEGVVHEHPVYAEWIRFFGSDAYGEIVLAMQQHFEAMARLAGPAAIEQLEALFVTSVRLEREFWDMAYRMRQWPDVHARSS